MKMRGDGRLLRDVLIVCRNEAHALQVIEAFQMYADHIVWGDALAGARYQKIIAFVPTDKHEPVEQIQQYIELLKLKLKPDYLDQLFLL